MIQTRASILDILNETVPNSCPNIRQLVQCLKILQPRYYSIASSPLMDADRLDIAFTVVNYVPPKRTTRVHGVCTSWLEGLCQEFDRQRQQGIRVCIRGACDGASGGAAWRSSHDHAPP